MNTHTKNDVNFAVEQDIHTAMRVGRVWREIRRGVANGKLRGLIFENDEFTIEPGQFDTLEQIAMHESIRMGDLADAMHVDPSTATRAVQRLIKDGLAERISHNGDGRVVVIATTPFGRRVFETVVEKRREMIVKLMEQFSDAERLILADMLERFNEALGVAVRDMSVRF